MTTIFYAIADFFKYIFSIMDLIENTLNYFYIVVIFMFLVLWTLIMLNHRKKGEEHQSSTKSKPISFR